MAPIVLIAGRMSFVQIRRTALPAWIELSLAKRETLQSVQLTFDTNVNRRIRHPLFRYPECVKTYDVAVYTGAGGKLWPRSRTIISGGGLIPFRR